MKNTSQPVTKLRASQHHLVTVWGCVDHCLKNNNNIIKENKKIKEKLHGITV